MEIDITSLLELDCFNLSHSAAEGGHDAGRNTWNASLAEAGETPLLDSPDKLEAMREFARDSGGWDAEEIAGWSDTELNALFLQWIAGDVRRMPAVRFIAKLEAHAPDRRPRADSLDEIDWKAAEQDMESGLIPSNLFRTDDGRIFFYLGN